MLSVYNYEDPVHFINDFLRSKKAEEEDFSLRKWSRELGFTSTAPLLDVLNKKKKIKGKVLRKIIGELPIDKSELMYFQALVERSLNDDEEKKVMYDLLIKELSTKNYGDNYSCKRSSEVDLFSHWIDMALLSIYELSNFEFNTKNIIQVLNEDIEEHIVDEALERLVMAGLLECNEKGELCRQYDAFSTKTDIKEDNVGTYFSLVCELAKKSIDISLKEREFQCFSLAIPKSELPLAKEIIRKCRKQLASLSDSDRNDMVYQTNLMMFPLTNESS